QKHHGIGPPYGDLSDFAGAARCTARPDHPDHMARNRLAYGARPADADGRAGTDHEVAFGLAGELVDDKPKRRLAPFIGLGTERLAARTDGAQAKVVAAARVEH